VREQQPDAIGFDRKLVRRVFHGAGHQIVVAVHVGVPRRAEALRDLRMALPRAPELLLGAAGDASGQGFPDVPQQHDLLEVPLEEFQKAHELGIVVAEEIRGSRRAKMQVRDDGDLHESIC
jgi:hypothetical protein